jgi:hypothetical protein
MARKKQVEDALKMWHSRIGRFLGAAEWSKSLGITCPAKLSKGGKGMVRLGSGFPIIFMMDAKSAVMIDNQIDLASIHSLENQECDFFYGKHIKDVSNSQKTQINWALDEAREYPLLIVRLAKKSAVECLAVSHTKDQITVCIPSGNFSFDPQKVRQARNHIVSNGLERKWTRAASLRESISLNEHERLPIDRRNKELALHAEMLALFPLSVYLPSPGSGEYIALAESLAEKPEVDITNKARDIYKSQKNIGVENVA